jgi:hypothetical protein
MTRIFGHRTQAVIGRWWKKHSKKSDKLKVQSLIARGLLQKSIANERKVYTLSDNLRKAAAKTCNQCREPLKTSVQTRSSILSG